MATGTGQVNSTGSYLSLSIWHPDCWTLEVTDAHAGGMVGHGVYNLGETVKGRFTVYGESKAERDALVDAIAESELTESVWELENRADFDNQMPTPGNAAESVVVTYDEQTSINDALVSKGFIPGKAVWIHDGREYWSVVVEENREEVQDRLDAIRDEMNADIEVLNIVSDNRESAGVLRRSVLSERQHDVFELARKRGYYNWPREVSATELAEELDVSKQTVLEHLRKAESKLFDALP
jgi:predicted DNA binding protein